MKEERRSELGEEKICENKMEEKVRQGQGGGTRRKIKMRDGRVLDHTGEGGT